MLKWWAFDLSITEEQKCFKYIRCIQEGKWKSFIYTHKHIYTNIYTHIDSILGTLWFLFKCFHCQFSVQSLIYSAHSCISLSQGCPGDKTKFILVQQHFTFCPPLNTFHKWSFIYTFWFSKIPCSNISS